MTPRTWNNVLKGYNQKYKKAEENHRELCITIISPHLSKADRKKTLPQLMPLPWEAEYKKFIKKAVNKKLSREEAKKKAREVFNKIDGKIDVNPQ